MSTIMFKVDRKFLRFIYLFSGDVKKNDMLVFGEVKQWVLCNLVRLKKLQPLPEEEASEYNTMVRQKQNTPKVFQRIWWGHLIWETFSVAFR